MHRNPKSHGPKLKNSIVKVNVPGSHFLVQCLNGPHFRYNITPITQVDVPEAHFSDNAPEPNISCAVF